MLSIRPAGGEQDGPLFDPKFDRFFGAFDKGESILRRIRRAAAAARQRSTPVSAHAQAMLFVIAPRRGIASIG